MLALITACLSSANAMADSNPPSNEADSLKFCQFHGKNYPINAIINISNGEKLICKAYDAIIPKSADRLEKGYTYWEKEVSNIAK